MKQAEAVSAIIMTWQLIWWGDVKTDGSAMAMIPMTPSEARQERLPHILRGVCSV